MIKRVKEFNDLHKETFILPNAWNGGSAKIFEREGFKAIGTTSAGIAYAKGYPDGEQICFSDLRSVVSDILKVVSIPLTVDMERGYGEALDDIKNNVRDIICLGAVGINIEDGCLAKRSVDKLEDFKTKITVISSLKDELGIDFFINARIDIFLMGTGTLEEMVNETIERANALKEAGVNGIFVPGPLSKETIERLMKAIDLPLNIYLHKAYADVESLKTMGIKRISTGSAPVRTAFNSVIENAKELARDNIDGLLLHEFSYGTANDYFK